MLWGTSSKEENHLKPPPLFPLLSHLKKNQSIKRWAAHFSRLLLKPEKLQELPSSSLFLSWVTQDPDQTMPEAELHTGKQQ